MPTDLATLDSDSGVSGSDPKQSESKVDYEAKYKGEQRRSERLNAELDALKQKYDNLLGDKADLEAKLRGAEKSVTEQLKSVTERAEKAEKERATFEKQLTRLQERETVRAKIRQDYPELIDLSESGDLKSPGEFDKPEEYEAYLKRMAAKVVPGEKEQSQPQAQQQQPPEEQPRRVDRSGQTPPADTRSRASNRPRSLEEIQDELWATDGNNPAQRDRYYALIQEMNQAMAQVRR